MPGGRCRILVIEDDRETAEQIVEFLAASGYEVDLAVDGDEGLSRARSAGYAVMTIDRMLPGIDGIAVIRRLREEGIITPTLIVSALGEIDDRVRGLRAGGDDYLVKPFAFAELLARVEALARRSATVVKETVLRVGDLELDLVSRIVSRGDRCRGPFAKSLILRGRLGTSVNGTLLRWFALRNSSARSAIVGWEIDFSSFPLRLPS